MDNSELFRKCIEDNKHSEIRSIPYKLKDGSEGVAQVEIRILNNKERRMCRFRAKKTVADLYDMKPLELEDAESMEEFREEVIYELLYASFYIPGCNTRFFPSSSAAGEFHDDWLTAAIELYSEVNANASVVETVSGDGENDSPELVQRLKEGALDPSNFLAQSSVTSQIHLMNILVKQLQTCQKDNASLTLQLDVLTKKTKAGKD